MDGAMLTGCEVGTWRKPLLNVGMTTSPSATPPSTRWRPDVGERLYPIHRDRQHPSDGGRVRFMTTSGGYVMVRRPRCMPYVMAEKAWLQLPFFEEGEGR